MSIAIPVEVRGFAAPYAALALTAAAARATSALLLVPLLGTLFTTGPGAAIGWLGALTGAILVGWFAEMRLMGYGFDISSAVANRTNHDMVDHLLAVPVSDFQAKQQAASKKALAGTVPELFAAFVNLGGQTSIAVFTPLLIGIGLLFVAWPLGLVALVATPILIAALLYGARLMRGAEAEFSDAAEEAAERTDEFARAQMVLRAAGRTGTDGTALGHAIDAQRKTALKLTWMTIPGTLIFTIALQVVLAAMIVVTGFLFAGGHIDAIRTVALIVVVVRYIEPFKVLSDIFPAIESARGAWKRIEGVFALPRLPNPAMDAAPAAPAVAFRNVGYSPGGKDVLKDISFTVQPGTTTAIVGPSGAGKSTILSLVARFRDADSGQVLVAGRDVRDYLPTTLMSQIAIVFQNVQLFEGSIIENIRIARPGASMEEIRRAAKAARVDDIIERLGGWDAPVGEGGGRLSGGERQRVSLARALLKDAPILLLDEATSSLDTGNEAAIAAALRGFRDRTVLIVAHRMETIAHADNVVFVEAGSIAEAGPRKELIKRGGSFADYWAQRRAARDWRILATE